MPSFFWGGVMDLKLDNKLLCDGSAEPLRLLKAQITSVADVFLRFASAQRSRSRCADFTLCEETHSWPSAPAPAL